MTKQSGAKIEPLERPSDFHPQDWIIIVEALAQWAGLPDEATGRRERAYELLDAISNMLNLPVEEIVPQIDDEYF